MHDHVFLGPKYEAELDAAMLLDKNSIVYHIEPTDTTLAHLIAKTGKFGGSVKEAKRNGWNKPIPSGYSEYIVGSAKNRIDVVVWDPSTTLAEFRCPDCLPDGTCGC